MPTRFDASAGQDVVAAFIDDDWSAIMVKVVASGTDPVEFNPNAARSLAAGLLRLADEMDEHDA
jgi:hypothetical protein